MKNLREFLSQSEEFQAKKGVIGTETEWMPICEFTIFGKTFLVGDFQVLPAEEDGVRIPAKPGKYKVEGKVIDFSGERRVSRLRVYKCGKKPKKGKQLGETWTDTAMTGVCDFERLSKEWSDLGNEKAEERMQTEYEKGNDCGVFTLRSRGTKVPFVSSGFGDGTFPIFELRAGASFVGFEVEFISAATPYPFETRRAVPETRPNEREKESAQVREAAWSKFGAMLDSVRKSRTGHKRKDRQKVEEAFGGFMRSLEHEALAGLEPLRKYIQDVRRRSLPLTAEYSPMSDTAWLAEKPVAARIEALQADGFEFAGCFQPTVAPSSWRAGFVHRNGHSYAAVVRGKSGTSLSIGYAYRDGSEDEFTDAPVTMRSLPPWLRSVSRPDLLPGALITLAQEQRRPGELKPTTKGDYAEMASAAWSRFVAWRAETGGLPLSYFQQKFQKPDDPETLEKIEMMRRDEADKSLCNWLRLQGDLSLEPDGFLDALAIIHDDLSASNLAMAWRCATNDLEIRNAEFSGGNPRKVFAEINQRRGNKLRLVVEKRGEFPADFYLPAKFYLQVP